MCQSNNPATSSIAVGDLVERTVPRPDAPAGTRARVIHIYPDGGFWVEVLDGPDRGDQSWETYCVRKVEEPELETYVIINTTRRSPNAPRVEHNSHAAAEAEAKRLVKKQPQDTFIIYKAVAKVTATTTVTPNVAIL